MPPDAQSERLTGLIRWIEVLDRIRVRKPRWAIRLWLILLLLIVFLLDSLTGPVTMSLAYGLVVLAAAHLEGEVGVLWTVLASALLDAWAETLWGDAITTNQIVDESIRMVMWLLLGSVAVLLRERIRVADERRRELQRAYRHIQEDLEAAELVQQAFMGRPLPRHPALALHVRRLVARKLGGDFYDVGLGGDRLTLLVADVSGKGSAAALVTGLLRGALADVLRETSAPGEVLRLLNRAVYEHVPDGMFVTCFYGCLDLAAGELVYGSAGHDPALLRRVASVNQLPATGIPLGIEPAEIFGEERLALEPGDLLLVYTDGLVDSRAPGGERLGLEGVEAALREPLAPEALTLRLEGLVREREGAQPQDDAILLAAQWRP